MTPLETIGRRFQAARRAADLTQEQVAGKVGLARSSIANFEAGRQDCPLSVVLLMCGIVGVALSDLAGDEGSRVNPLEQYGALRFQLDTLQAEADLLRERTRLQAQEMERLARVADYARARPTPAADA